MLLLDGDEAGRKAVERLAPAAARGRAPSTRVALLPEGRTRTPSPARPGGDGGAGAARRGGARSPSTCSATLLPEGRAGDASSGRWRPWGGSDPWWRSCRWGWCARRSSPGWRRTSGLPAAELEAGLRGKGPLLRPVPKPAPAAAPARAERPLDRAEAALGALFLTRPELIRGAAAGAVAGRGDPPGAPGGAGPAPGRERRRRTRWRVRAPGCGRASRRPRGYFHGMPSSCPRPSRPSCRRLKLPGSRSGWTTSPGARPFSWGRTSWTRRRKGCRRNGENYSG